MKTIIHTFEIKTERDDAHRALTTLEGLAGWWTPTVTGDPSQAGVIDFAFGGDFNPDMRVDSDGADEVAWTCVGGHENWVDNTFRFQLRGTSPVSLRFIQDYAQELDDDTYGTYNFNWGYYLNSLRLLLETGTGTPYGGR